MTSGEEIDKEATATEATVESTVDATVVKVPTRMLRARPRSSSLSLKNNGTSGDDEEKLQDETITSKQEDESKQPSDSDAMGTVESSELIQNAHVRILRTKEIEDKLSKLIDKVGIIVKTPDSPSNTYMRYEVQFENGKSYTICADALKCVDNYDWKPCPRKHGDENSSSDSLDSPKPNGNEDDQQEGSFSDTDEDTETSTFYVPSRKLRTRTRSSSLTLKNGASGDDEDETASVHEDGSKHKSEKHVMGTAESNGLRRNVTVRIQRTTDVEQRLPKMIDRIGVILETPRHPNTWFRVRFENGKVFTFRASALKRVDDSVEEPHSRRGDKDSSTESGEIQQDDDPQQDSDSDTTSSSYASDRLRKNTKVKIKLMDITKRENSIKAYDGMHGVIIDVCIISI